MSNLQILAECEKVALVEGFDGSPEKIYEQLVRCYTNSSWGPWKLRETDEYTITERLVNVIEATKPKITLVIDEADRRFPYKILGLFDDVNILMYTMAITDIATFVRSRNQ